MNITHERKREKEKGGEEKGKGTNREMGRVNNLEALSCQQMLAIIIHKLHCIVN